MHESNFFVITHSEIISSELELIDKRVSTVLSSDLYPFLVYGIYNEWN